MPEGHTIHRLAAEHNRRLAGQVISSSSPQGRFTAGAELIDGRLLQRAQAYGKHLLLAFGGRGEQASRRARPSHWVHVHLGLYGKFRSFRMPEREPVGQVRWRMLGETYGYDLRGATACEVYTEEDRSALLQRLGPDPLRTDADPQAFTDRILRSSAPIATLLMDQSVIAGVGNVYRAEVLFRAGMSPRLPGKKLTEADAEALWRDLVALLKIGKRRGRIDTVDDADAPTAATRTPRSGAAKQRPRPGGRHGGHVFVYHRDSEACYLCGTTVQMTELNARKLYWCPTCQQDA